jgi:hypothetical protein
VSPLALLYAYWHVLAHPVLPHAKNQDIGRLLLWLLLFDLGLGLNLRRLGFFIPLKNVEHDLTSQT